MRLVSVGVADFRNIEEVYTEFHERLNVFCGKNGEGKSNLLEAIHFISTLQTMRSVNKRNDLIRFECVESQIKGHFFLNSPLKIEVEIHEKGKKARIENKAIKDVSSIARKIGVVCFVPSDLEIVRGGPKERRRALDKFCFQMEPDFIQVARDFEKF